MNTIESLELKIAKFLRVGVAVAGGLMFVGWCFQIKWSGDPFFNFRIYDQIPFKDMVEFAIYRKQWGILISYTGLVTLISLPVIRVLLTTYLFLRQKEKILAGIAAVVLLGLILSMTLGIEL